MRRKMNTAISTSFGLIKIPDDIQSIGQISRSGQVEQLGRIHFGHLIDFLLAEPLRAQLLKERDPTVRVQGIPYLSEISRQDTMLGPHGANRGGVIVKTEGDRKSTRLNSSH